VRSNINLHIHTTHSDGGKTVAEVVERLWQAGIQYFSITDHDEVEGNIEATELAKVHGMKYCNGVELSCCFDGEAGLDESYVFHIVGLDFDLAKMETELQRILSNKEEKLVKLAKQLVSDGYGIDINHLFRDGQVNARKNIAQELISKGYAKNMDEAFEKILNTDRYRPYARNVPTIKEGLEIIKRCGGVTVWAHPFGVARGGKKDLTEKQVTELAKIFTSYGFDGVEVYYQHYSTAQIKFLEALADKYNFWKSVGTDYHGVPPEKMYDPEYAAKLREQMYFEKDGIEDDVITIVKYLKPFAKFFDADNWHIKIREIGSPGSKSWQNDSLELKNGCLQYFIHDFELYFQCCAHTYVFGTGYVVG